MPSQVNLKRVHHFNVHCALICLGSFCGLCVRYSLSMFCEIQIHQDRTILELKRLTDWPELILKKIDIIFQNQGFVFLILPPLTIVVTVWHGCLLGNTSCQDACVLMSLVLLHFLCSSLTTGLIRDDRKINRGMTFTWTEFALKAKNNIGNVLSWGYGSTCPDRTKCFY